MIIHNNGSLLVQHYYFCKSATLQYSTHLVTSFTASEPSGTGYSNSMSQVIGHLFFLDQLQYFFDRGLPFPKLLILIGIRGLWSCFIFDMEADNTIVKPLYQMHWDVNP